MAILKKIEGLELYLYMNGNLIYKRWLETGKSKVFDVMAYDKYTLCSIRDLEFESPNRFLPVKARIKLKTEEEGGRTRGIIKGYRPNHVFEYNKEGKLEEAFAGDIVFKGEPIEPGEEREVLVRFLINQPVERYLDKGRVWFLHEGPVCIGHAELI